MAGLTPTSSPVAHVILLIREKQPLIPAHGLLSTWLNEHCTGMIGVNEHITFLP